MEIEKARTLKVLMIGNSFSEDTVPHMSGMAKSVGFTDFEIATLMIGGCPLSLHYSNSKSGAKNYDFYRFDKDRDEWVIVGGKALIDGFNYSKWDYVTIQQASHFSGKPDTYNQDLDGMISFIKEHNKNAKIVWNMTWAYGGGYPGLELYGNSQMEMYNSIVSTVQSKIENREEFFAVSPAGTAIQNARTSFLGDTLNRDGLHLSYGLGRYISGLTMFCVLTGYSPSEVLYRPDGIDEKHIAVAKESVENALKQKYSITNSKYTK